MAVRAPKGLKSAGKRLWKAVIEVIDLSPHEETLMTQACRIADRLESLQAVVDADGPVVQSPQGVKAHPALVEFRQQSLVLAKLVGQLQIPVDIGSLDGTRRPGATRARRDVRDATDIAERLGAPQPFVPPTDGDVSAAWDLWVRQMETFENAHPEHAESAALIWKKSTAAVPDGPFDAGSI